MAYDFKSLSPLDFEELARDLIGAELKLLFESFAPGPDGGIDGRHSRGKQRTILQAKHYAGSGFQGLVKALKNEKKKVKALKPKRYVLATSVPLAKDRKDKIFTMLAPYVKNAGDIFDRTLLNALLRKFPKIEKTHFKLWLSSTAVLEQVVRAAVRSKTKVTEADIIRKLQLYVPNRSLDEALRLLEDKHVVIVSGAPGVGKTTLAEMLANLYVGEGYTLIVINSLNEGFAEIDDSEPQLFFFDDFLGKVKLNEDAIRYRDSLLAAFIKRVRMSPNARFILTTRQYIFERARQISESLADEKIAVSKYVLDVGAYTRRIRARIIYNHLLFSNLPSKCISALVKSKIIPRLVDHRHFNPRIVEWMTDVTYLPDTTPSEYPKYFLNTLDHPEKLWDHAFHQHIQPRSRHLLMALFFFEFGAKLDELRIAFELFHAELCKKYNIQAELHDFEVALRELEGSFLSVHGNRVDFINPSVADYLENQLADRSIIRCAARVVPFAGWTRELWRYSKRNLAQLNFTIAQLGALFVDVAPTFCKIDGGIELNELSLPEKIELILDWWRNNGSTVFSKCALQLAKRPPKDFQQLWVARELGAILLSLNSTDFKKFPKRDEVHELLERKLALAISNGSLDMERLRDFRIEFVKNERAFSKVSADALHTAIRQEVDDVEATIASITSVDELRTYADDLRENANWANLQLDASFDSLIEYRADSIADETDSSPDPDELGISGDEDVELDDAEIELMFDGLIHHLER